MVRGKSRQSVVTASVDLRVAFEITISVVLCCCAKQKVIEIDWPVRIYMHTRRMVTLVK